MKRNLRTSEEKDFDAKLKSAILKLGPNPTAEDEPTPYPYSLAWDRLGRKGQRCKVIKTSLKTVLIQFEDGFETVINRMGIRRI